MRRDDRGRRMRVLSFPLLTLLVASPASAETKPAASGNTQSRVSPDGAPARARAAMPEMTPQAALDLLRAGSVTPQMFGGVGDCSVDDTDAVNAAIATGRNVVLPDQPTGPGCYKVGASLSGGANSIQGLRDDQSLLGTGATEIQGSNAATDVIVIGDPRGRTISTHVTLAGLHLTSPEVDRRGGSAAIHAYHTRYALLRDVQVGSDVDYARHLVPRAKPRRTGYGHWYDGIVFKGVSYDTLLNVTVVGGHRHGITVSGDGGDPQSGVGPMGVGFTVDEQSRIVQFDGSGLNIAGGVGGINLGVVDVSLNGVGVEVSRANVDAPNAQIFLGDRTTIDTNGGYGVEIQPDSVLNWMATGTWFASTTQGPNVVVRRPQSGLFEWTGAHCLNAAAGRAGTGNDGYVLEAGTHVFSGGSVVNNTGRGISASGVADLKVSGVEVLNNGKDGLTLGSIVSLSVTGTTFKGNRGCAVNVSNAGISFAAVTGNIWTGNGVTGAGSCGTIPSDANHVVTNNAGVN